MTHCTCGTLCECIRKNYACIKKFTTINPFVNVPGGTLEHIHECTDMDDSIILVDVNHIKNECIHIEFQNEKHYICESVNNVEFE